jgi:hypothetical protein
VHLVLGIAVQFSQTAAVERCVCRSTDCCYSKLRRVPTRTSTLDAAETALACL